MKIFIDLSTSYYKYAQGYIEHFKRQGHDVVVVETSNALLKEVGQEKFYELFANCDIASMANISVTKELLDLAPNLKLICTFGSGYGYIDIKSAGERGIPVVNGRGGGAIAVAELSVSMMAALTRKLPQYDHELRNHIWKSQMGGEMYGKTVGIVGVGAIGSEIARILHLGYNMDVLAYDVVENQKLIEDYGAKYVDLETLCAQSDYITVHTPLFPSTKGMINERLFSLMKPTAFFVNASRGPVVVEEDLYQALKDGVIAGAGLDVFDPEPPVKNRFAEMRNVVMTPHTGALTPETAQRIAEILTANIEDVIAGRPPHSNVVNKEFIVNK